MPLLGLQLATVAAALLWLALYPPAHGRMLLVPLYRGAEQDMIARAIRMGAAPVGDGPIANSFVILGDRDRLARAMLDHGVLLLASPPSGCGGFA